MKIPLAFASIFMLAGCTCHSGWKSETKLLVGEKTVTADVQTRVCFVLSSFPYSSTSLVQVYPELDPIERTWSQSSQKQVAMKTLYKIQGSRIRISDLPNKEDLSIPPISIMNNMQYYLIGINPIRVASVVNNGESRGRICPYCPEHYRLESSSAELPILIPTPQEFDYLINNARIYEISE
jgi:hypothetical protein